MENNILSLLSKEEKAFLDVRTYSKNQVIFKENSQCDSIGILTSGKVEIISYSFSGEEIIYNLLGKNQIFGNNLLFSSDAVYKGDVVSRGDTTIVFIKKGDLIHLLSSNQKFLEAYLRVQSDFGKNLNSRIKLYSMNSAEERFNYYLYLNKNVIEYGSITSLASQLNLKRETLSRLISKLEKENAIKRSPHKIVKLD